MTLILLPNLLAENTESSAFPPVIAEKVDVLQGLIAESDKGARQFLKKFKKTVPVLLLNEHTKDFSDLLAPLLKGETWGLISDAGLPCLADPGSQLVEKAREKKINVEAHVGPSSIILALMLSGLPSQKFFFHGYLPYELEELKKLDKGVTHLFIEAPYRNIKSFQKIKQVLKPNARLCIAANLMAPDAYVETKIVSQWKDAPSIDKVPSLFLIYT